MYFVAIILVMFVAPVASVAADALRAPNTADLMWLIGKWFTFWAVGARLFVAGLTQSFRPQFTAQSIFDIKDQRALAIVREVGFGNLAIGALGLASIVEREWVVPAALAGGLFYGLALVGHVLRQNRNFKEQVALASDAAVFVVLAVFHASQLA